MKPSRLESLSILAVLGLTSCLRTGESRAECDETVGHESNAGLQLDVEGGLARVEELTAGHLHLWAAAPNLQLTLTRAQSSTRHWEVLVDNCMPDAELVAPGATELEVIPRERPTECGWSLTLPESDPVGLTIASPRASIRDPYRFGVLSDVQDAVDQVGDFFTRMNQDPALSFVISAGDLTESGAPSEYRRFRSELGALDVPFFSTVGNHDISTSDACRFQRYFGRGSFQFEYRGVHFTLLDAAGGTVDPIAYGWLDGWLEEGKEAAHVVTTHVAPVDPVGTRNGSFASRNEAAMLLARLAEGDVDLTLYGHLHSHYCFENAGIEAHISGGGGAYPERFDGIGRHYLTVDVVPATQTFAVDVVRIDR